MDEPLVPDTLRDGADIVAFSGDKLLGASQAGIVVGKRNLVERTASNQMARALRIDKLSLAALDATLKLYTKWPTRAHEHIPTLAMLTMSVNEMSIRAEEIRTRLSSLLGSDFEVDVEPGVSKAGGGTLPLLELPTVLVSVSSPKVSADAIEKALRLAPTPVIARIAEDKVLLDPRTLLDGDLDALVDAFRSVTTNGNE